MSLIKKHHRLLFFGILIFIELFFINTTLYSYDATWEYGMSHAIKMGELPYLDFNLVTTPFFLFLCSLGLLIKDSFIVYLLESFIINLIIFYYIDKVYQEKSLVYLLSICLMFFYSLIPTYNSLAMLIILLLICIEKLQYSHKKIGFLWGLLILTKHTIGIPLVFFVLIGLWINKAPKKEIIERLLYMIFPILVFIIYLIGTNSFSSFIDLCILGLFDFASNNTDITIYFYLFILMMIDTIIQLRKHKNNLNYYYLLGSSMLVIPIFDISHFSLYFIVFVVVLIDKYSRPMKKTISIYLAILVFICMHSICYLPIQSNLVFSNMNHFEYILTGKETITSIKNLHKKLSQYENYYIFDELGMYYNIIYDRKISYYDLPHYGNFGYHGNQKLLDRLAKSHHSYFVISHDEKHNNLCKQLNKEAIDYIKNNYQKVESVDIFTIYYKE